ncbi:MULTISPECIES: cyclopropane-fatty-acyl-phospholipid synthase family protein [unclassified Crossiella]|uniref:SAM-dependent methyltransferase n=1 Tax=unclassified Crossiella TaxID=2620835 RepID=UPI001FFFE0C5|nr:MULTISPECIES: cyclopropane-fatty-acyl-phospholipid synthase family protein [unclassified Crossiella]MCK2240875.1 cyclopropane-fatty-acyl-phospholipid synthase family protein [Crossiella sp. S99.2]MCK2253981.1 cyclopropane-fatty-acyl-phospholipid synthase family protein [Crossiella sp. S99.1]
MPEVAATLGRLVEDVLGAGLPVRVRGWDGSEVGPSGGPVVVLRSPVGVRRLVWDPSELGFARAFVAGEIEVEGDLYEALRRVWAFARERGRPRVGWRQRVRAVRVAARLGVLGWRPAAPAEEARLRGRVHTRGRDRAAIAHHYDLGNEFYEALLEPHMAYSCGYWTSGEADYTHTDAQRDKLDLVCRKLGLRPGMRFLDVGCGWGSLILFAAEHYGVRATGITLSARQGEFVRRRIAERGLGDLVEVRVQDYRELAGEPFDAVASIEMGEHVGAANYPVYTATLFRMTKAEGRLLLQQMSRGAVAPGGGAFIEGYVAPDMTMRPVGQTVDALEQAGFEVRDVHALREHYVRSVLAWADTLAQHWDEFTQLAGVGQARVWRLYLAGGALAFAENRMGVDQILAVRPTASGVSGMPDTREHLLSARMPG